MREIQRMCHFYGVLTLNEVVTRHSGIWGTEFGGKGDTAENVGIPRVSGFVILPNWRLAFHFWRSIFTFGVYFWQTRRQL